MMALTRMQTISPKVNLSSDRRRRVESLGVVQSVGFLEPHAPQAALTLLQTLPSPKAPAHRGTVAPTRRPAYAQITAVTVNSCSLASKWGSRWPHPGRTGGPFRRICRATIWTGVHCRASEGAFGIVRSLGAHHRKAEAYRNASWGVFESVDGRGPTPSANINRRRIIPALWRCSTPHLESDRGAFHFGFPLDAGGRMIREVDGVEGRLGRRTAERIVAIWQKKTQGRESTLRHDEAETAASSGRARKQGRRRRRLARDIGTQDGGGWLAAHKLRYFFAHQRGGPRF